MTFVITLLDYVPSPRYDGSPPGSVPWTQAMVAYSDIEAGPFTILDTIDLTPIDADARMPQARNLTVTNSPSQSGWFQVTFLDVAGNSEPTTAIPWPLGTVFGAANATQLSARYAVRHRIRDGVPMLDTNPVPFNQVRLESLSDQVQAVPTPTQTTFQCRFSDIPTQRYMNAQVCPGTLVAFVDGAWNPVTPSQDVDANGLFTLPVAPIVSLAISYAWQYFADGEIDQFTDEARAWLREFATIDLVPDGLTPALISYASGLALEALARSATLPSVQAADSNVGWDKIAAAYVLQAKAQGDRATAERLAWYTQGPEALDPMVGGFSSPSGSPYTPLR
jgi:hypothetical protein